MCGCGLIYVSGCNVASILFYFLTDKFPQLLELFHLLHIWHKAKKISKCLHQVRSFFIFLLNIDDDTFLLLINTYHILFIEDQYG